MKYLLLILLSANVFAGLVPGEGAEYEKNHYSAIDRKYNLGTAIVRGATVMGSYKAGRIGQTGVGSINLFDRENQPVRLPNGAVITDCLIDVVTAPTGSPSQLRFDSKAAGDLKGATGVASYTGLVACTPVGSAATSIKVASETTIKVFVLNSEPAVGELNVFIQYVISSN